MLLLCVPDGEHHTIHLRTASHPPHASPRFTPASFLRFFPPLLSFARPLLGLRGPPSKQMVQSVLCTFPAAVRARWLTLEGGDTSEERWRPDMVANVDEGKPCRGCLFPSTTSRMLVENGCVSSGEEEEACRCAVRRFRLYSVSNPFFGVVVRDDTLLDCYVLSVVWTGR